MNKDKTLKLFNFSHPLLNTEINSIIGDKFSGSLPFKIEIVDSLEAANVVLWDGIVTPKNRKVSDKIIKSIGPDRVLFLIGESMTLFKGHDVAQPVDSSGLNVVELPGWTILPEEIISKVQNCYQKLYNV